MVVPHRRLAVLAAAAVVVACYNQPAPTPAPTGGGAMAAPAPTPPPPGVGQAAVVGGAGGAAPAAPPRAARPAPDSVRRLRATILDSFAKAVAGHESEPAERYFKNVTVLKGQTVTEFLATMEAYSNALSLQCGSCHVLTDYSADTRPNKGRSRIMQIMTDAINAEHLPKLNPTRPPKATCMTCHHGLTSPNQALDAALQRANEAAGYPANPPGTVGRGGGEH